MAFNLMRNNEGAFHHPRFSYNNLYRNNEIAYLLLQYFRL